MQSNFEYNIQDFKGDIDREITVNESVNNITNMFGGSLEQNELLSELDDVALRLTEEFNELSDLEQVGGGENLDLQQLIAQEFNELSDLEQIGGAKEIGLRELINNDFYVQQGGSNKSKYDDPYYKPYKKYKKKYLMKKYGRTH